MESKRDPFEKNNREWKGGRIDLELGLATHRYSHRYSRCSGRGGAKSTDSSGST